MRPVRPLAAALLAAALAGPLRAQAGDQPNLIFTIAGGLSLAAPLWSLDKQAAAVADYPVSQSDTVALARRLRPGLTALLGATLFRSRHVGYTLEAAFFGLASEARCTVRDSFLTDTQRINEQTCTDLQGRHVPTNAVGFQAGAVYRFTARRIVEPYVRASAGFALLGNSFVETSGIVQSTSACAGLPTCRRFFLAEARRKEITWLVSLAAGTSLNLGPGYRFHAEVRDLVIALPVVTGAAPVLSLDQTAQVGTRVRHIPVLTAGVDIVLERRHTRRY